MQKAIQFFSRESTWFFLLLIIFSWPVWRTETFATLDGPAHLYNARLLVEMAEGNAFLSQHFELNSLLLPNWSGHWLMFIGHQIGGWFFAEKLPLACYIIGFPLAGRFLVRQLNPNQMVWSIIFFPISLTSFFFLGFNNYCLATAFFLLALGYFMKHFTDTPQRKHYLILFLLLAAIYFSHLVMCAFTIGSLGLLTLFYSRKSNRFSWRQLLFFCSLILPFLLLFVWYFTNQPSGNYTSHWTTEKLMSGLYIWPNFHMANDFDANLTQLPVKIWFLFGIGYFGIGIIKKGQKLSKFSKSFWLVPIVALLGYFLLPDEASNAGYITSRFLGLFVTTTVIWLISLPWPKWTNYWSIPIYIMALYGSNKLLHTQQGINGLASSCIEIGEDIPANSVVFPLSTINNWFTHHFSNYSGIEKPMVILENYEATVGYFPLSWQSNKGEAKWNNNLVDSYDLQSSTDGAKVTHILLIGNVELLNSPWRDLLEEKNVKKLSQRQNCHLYSLVE